MGIKEIIRNHMKKHCLSQSDLGRLAGIHPSVISQLSTGKAKLTPRYVERLVEAGMSYDELKDFEKPVLRRGPEPLLHNTPIALIVYEYLNENDKTQEQLAKMIGTNVTYLRRVLSGKTPVSDKLVIRLSLIGIDKEDLEQAQEAMNK